MNVLITILNKEENRINNMISQYSKEIEILPKGKIFSKNIKGHSYFYLCYREKEKVITKYIGTNNEKITEIKEKIERRNQIECILKKLKEEKKIIKKMEELI